MSKAELERLAREFTGKKVIVHTAAPKEGSMIAPPKAYSGILKGFDHQGTAPMKTHNRYLILVVNDHSVPVAIPESTIKKLEQQSLRITPIVRHGIRQ